MFATRLLLVFFICNDVYGFKDSKDLSAMKNLVENTLQEMKIKFQDIQNMVNESMHKLIKEVYTDDEILKNDCHNPLIRQWVSAVTNYYNQYDETSWPASAVIGKPNVYPAYGDIPGTWTQSTRAPDHFITVAFPHKTYIETINIYETYNAGAVKIIQTKMPNGSWYTVWNTSTATVITKSRIFSPKFKALAFLSNELKIVVDTTISNSYVEIDAVERIGTDHLERQWVSALTNFSDQYSTTSWSASKIIGEPDVYPSYGDLVGAWTQWIMKAPDHFITVAFSRKTFIQTINIYETYHGGAVIRIEAKMPNGTWHSVWSTASATDITHSRIFSPEIKAIPFLCNELKMG